MTGDGTSCRVWKRGHYWLTDTVCLVGWLAVTRGRNFALVLFVLVYSFFTAFYFSVLNFVQCGFH